MAGSNWQQLSGGSTNPWTIRRDDGTPTANYGDHIICDGGTVTLPSPQANEAVLVSNISSTTTIEPNGTETIEGESSVFFDQTDPIAFVSDGSDWYVSNNLDYISVIPDAGVRQWPFAERSNSTIIENLANDDGTVSGDPTNTADSSFYDGYYEATDGSDDAILLPVGEFESQIQSKDFGFAFTLKTSGSYNKLGGAADSNFNENMLLGGESNGLEFILGTGGNDVSVYTQTSLNDGTLRRVFIDVNTDDPSNWEIYLNDTADNAQVGFNRTLDLSNINLTGFVNDLALGASNVGGTLERFVDADYDHPILYDSPSRQDVTDDYNLQPFA